ncbi:MAG: glycine cleavage system protein GcvH [Clostridiales bacterium]|jgi:glycine cleavage system H protein|nr:glycine cleavage system protein GcvH [Clostridiales bacterium]
MNLKFSATHEWVAIGETPAAVGVTDFAAEQMGDVVFVELPEVGSKIFAGKPFANIESVKAVSEVFSPVTGLVVEVNSALADEPDLINRDAFSAYLVKVETEAYEDGLMTAEEYEKIKK